MHARVAFCQSSPPLQRPGRGHPRADHGRGRDQHRVARHRQPAADDRDRQRRAKSRRTGRPARGGVGRRRLFGRTRQSRRSSARASRRWSPPDADKRKEPRPGRRGGLYDFTRRVLATDWGAELYRKRQGTVEPVFGQIKSNRGANRFLGRGRSAVRSERRLPAATHNLRKLYQHQLAAS
jgi:hypothetical protein